MVVIYIWILYLWCVTICHSLTRDVFYGEAKEGLEITSHTIVVTYARVREECAMICLSDPRCYAISFTLGNGAIYRDCILKSESSLASNYVIANNPDMGYAIVQSKSSSTQVTDTTTTTPITTPTTASTTMTSASSSGGITVVDLVENIVNQCSSSSQKDFAVITHQGIYFYDDYTHLRTAPCKGPIDVTETFKGSSIPAVTEWDAVMYYQSYFDVYADDHVYRFQNAGNYLQMSSSYPKGKKAHIKYSTSNPGTIAQVPNQPTWAVNRRDTGGQLMYFQEGTNFYLYNNQNPKEKQFIQSETVLDNNSRDLNIWKHLPGNVVGMATCDNNGGRFIYVTQGDLFHYEMHQNGTVINHGKIQF